MGTSSGTRHFPAWSLLATTLIVLLPTITAAQEPVKSFDQLDTRLKPGDTVWVTDAQGREIKGKIRSFGEDSLTLAADTPITLDAVDVRRVQERKRDSLWNGLLFGLGAGTGACLLGFGSVENHDEGSIAAGYFCVVAIPAGAGIGVLVDALTHGKRDVYLSPTAPGVRLSLAPVITPRRSGVVVSFAF